MLVALFLAIKQAIERGIIIREDGTKRVLIYCMYSKTYNIISLIQYIYIYVDYKLLSGVLALIMKSVLPDLIGSQSRRIACIV